MTDTSTPDVLFVSTSQEQELQDNIEKLKRKNERLMIKKVARLRQLKAAGRSVTVANRKTLH